MTITFTITSRAWSRQSVSDPEAEDDQVINDLYENIPGTDDANDTGNVVGRQKDTSQLRCQEPLCQMVERIANLHRNYIETT
mmetsp:Transcript_87844/g.235629  ORF Transcript_87844/g.235629 Transcript_87844/m.235629 type:complete len:82 (+) Transcript_87844:341-586(+)